MLRRCLRLALLLALLGGTHGQRQGEDTKSFKERARELVGAMSLGEKLTQLSAGYGASGRVDRLGLPAFRGGNECLHGVRDDGGSPAGTTSFPVPLALAATFDAPLLRRVAAAISDEARALHNAYLASKNETWLLNCFAPNINLVRDPRWGRGHETYGEDPFLAGRLAAAFVGGLQGDHPRYTKVGATCKHFAAYSLESAEGWTRDTFDARVSARDFETTYAPAFRACVQEGRARSVMCSYNAVNGVPACLSKRLLTDTLRTRWGFRGFVVSDCGAIGNAATLHRFTNTTAESAAAALLAGVDAGCFAFDGLKEAVAQGLLSEGQLTPALERFTAAKLRLGWAGPRERDPWRHLGPDILGSRAHRQLAVEAGHKSIVLLKNEAGPSGRPTLPLDPRALRRLVLIGPHTNSTEALQGNYYSKPAGGITTPLQAFQAVLGPRRVISTQGAFVDGLGGDGEINAAGAACEGADACVLLLGLSSIDPHYQQQAGYGEWAPRQEGESVDRRDLRLPAQQESLVRYLARRTAAPLVVVLVHGGALDLAWLRDCPRVAAILTAWYPAQGAQAIADVVLGRVSPSGRLPVSFLHDNYTRAVPLASMAMAAWPGRTYRYLDPSFIVYPFGYGLSYTTFRYSVLGVAAAGASAGWAVSVNVTNTGGVASEDAVLLFVVFAGAESGGDAALLPKSSLRGFERVFLRPGATATVRFEVAASAVPDVVHSSLGAAACRGAWLARVGESTAVLPGFYQAAGRPGGAVQMEVT